jgi:hypothetical protein
VADRKISDLTALTTPATGDLIPIVDISEAAAADKNKSITVGELLRGAPDGTAAAPSFAFESDGGNGMFLGGTDILAFSTGGSQAVTIDASQRVGIGTSSPSDTLDIGTGGIFFSNQTPGSPFPEQKLKWSNDSTTANGFYISQGTDRNGKIWHEQGLDIQFGTNNQQRMVLDSSGNVGIGTASPVSKFVVASSGVGYEIDQSSVANTNLLISYDRAAGAYRAVDNRFSGYYAWNDTGIERARIDSSGRLLVGTSTSTSVGGFGEALIQAKGNFTRSITLINDTNDTNYSGLSICKRATGGSLSNGQALGGLLFQGYDGSSYLIGARIEGVIDGSVGTNDLPSRLVFSTTADGASSTDGADEDWE